MNGGNVLFFFKGDSKDLDKKLAVIGEKFKDVGKIVAGTLVASLAMATGEVIAFGKASLKAFAEYEQLQGGLVSMMQNNEESIERVMNASKTAYRDLTMSQNQYLQSFETSYAIIKNGLRENKDAIEYTNKALQLSSDLFNTFGGSTEQYANAINWALKGTFSYIDNLNLGIKGTQEGFVEATNASGVLGRSIQSVAELTNDEILDVLQYYAQSVGAWGKTSQEASSTVAGSLNMLKASWSDFIAGFGKEDANFDVLVDNLLTSLETFGNNLMPVIDRIMDNIINVLPGLIERLISYLPSLIEKLVPVVVQTAVSLIQAIVNALPKMLQVLATMLPGIIQSLIEGMITVINTLADMLPELIPQIVNAILEIIPILIDNLPLFLEAGWKLIVGLAKGIGNAIGDLVTSDKLPQLLDKLFSPIWRLPSKLGEIGGQMVRGMWEGIKNLGQWCIDKIKGLGKSILKAVKNIFGVHSPSTEFEFIGKMNMEGLNKGMEEMQPEIQKTIDGMFDLSPQLTNSMNNTLSPIINVENNVTMETDPLGQTVSRIKTFGNGAKNDYNYGMGVGV